MNKNTNICSRTKGGVDCVVEKLAVNVVSDDEQVPLSVKNSGRKKED